MQKLTKRQINGIAIVHSANVLRTTDMICFMENDISEKDAQEILKTIKIIANSITNVHASSVIEIIDYVKQKNS